MRSPETGRFQPKSPTRSEFEAFCGVNTPGIVVYAIVNSVNGHRYFGSSSSARRRLWKHLLDLRHLRHHSVVLQRAFEKYGESAFRVEILSRHESRIDAVQAEDALLKSSVGKPHCYNVSRRAAGPFLDPVAMEAAHEARRNSAKWRANLRTDQIHSSEARAKSKAACLSSAVFMANVAEQGARMKALLSKPVRARCMSTGRETAYPSATHAATETGVSRSVISDRCRRIHTTHAGGYFWEFA